jgi:hypothetical protein
VIIGQPTTTIAPETTTTTGEVAAAPIETTTVAPVTVPAHEEATTGAILLMALILLGVPLSVFLWVRHRRKRRAVGGMQAGPAGAPPGP